jgi:penicillin-binding protein 1A
VTSAPRDRRRPGARTARGGARAPAKPAAPRGKGGGGKAGATRGPAPARPRRVWRFLARWTAVAAVWGLVAAVAVLGWFAWDMPTVREVEMPTRRPAVTVLAADGTQAARLGDLVGEAVDSRDLPRHLVEAILAVEDRRFFDHFGVDPIGLARAAWVNWREGRVVQGGSTLTQQLAKNLFLDSERSLRRKAQEAMLAVWLERTYDKHQILTAYANRVYLGAGTYGFDAAARTYFGKPVSQVTLREAAILAGLLKAPSRFAPTRDPNEALRRAAVVLQAMVEAGFVTERQADAALAAAPTPRPRVGPAGDGRYFAEWAAEQARAFAGPVPRDLIVETTLDLRIQRAAEAQLDRLLAERGGDAGVSQGAIVVMDREGAVRALVGGRDWRSSPFDRATRALRQPGSAFKPVVFLAALDAGLRPESVVSAAPVRIGSWSPGNFEGAAAGDVTLTEAMARSLNTAAVRVLERGGVDRTRRLAASLGIRQPMARDLSLALGTSEVTLLELTGAYAAFASGGRPVEPWGVASIRDRDGAAVYRRPAGRPPRTLDPGRVAQLERMLVAVVEQGTGRAARLDRPAAGKTGTSQDHRDAWFVGYTADYVAGVWLGNDDNSPMERVTGGGLPAELWRAVMLEAHQGLPARPLPSASAPAPGAADPAPRAAPEDPLAALIRRLAEEEEGG